MPERSTQNLGVELTRLRSENRRLHKENQALRKELGQAARDVPPAENDTSQVTGVTNQSKIDEKIRLFRSLFRGREDVYPVRWENQKGRAGYSPACGNEWHKTLCGKPKVKCGACPNSQFLPVTDRVIHDHLIGKKTIGVYPILNDGSCRILAIDFDKTSWRDDIHAFVDSCAHFDIPAYVSAISQLAHYNWGELRWLESEQLYLRAVSLAPNDADIRSRYGTFLRHTGRTRRALDELLRARELGSDSASLVSRIVNTYAYLGEFANARAFFEARMAEVGLENMTGTEAYFVSLLADGMEAEAREFAALDLRSTAIPRIRFFLDRLDGIPGASERLVDATLKRIAGHGRPRWGDIDNLVLAGEIETAREYVPQTQGYGWSVPNRFILHINEEIDPRYLPYRPNLLPLVDLFPGVPEAFMDIGVDVMARGREKGFIE